MNKIMKYKDWRSFNKIINKAIVSANNSYPNQNSKRLQIDKIYLLFNSRSK